MLKPITTITQIRKAILHHIKIAQPLSALAGIHVNKKGENVYLFTEIKQPLGHTNLTTVEPLKEDSPIKGQCIIYPQLTKLNPQILSTLSI